MKGKRYQKMDKSYCQRSRRASHKNKSKSQLCLRCGKEENYDREKRPPKEKD